MTKSKISSRATSHLLQIQLHTRSFLVARHAEAIGLHMAPGEFTLLCFQIIHMPFLNLYRRAGRAICKKSKFIYMIAGQSTHMNTICVRMWIQWMQVKSELILTTNLTSKIRELQQDLIHHDWPQGPLNDWILPAPWLQRWSCILCPNS